MRHHAVDRGRVLAAATEDQGAVVDLTRALVHIPSRAGIDLYDPIVDLIRTSGTMITRNSGTVFYTPIDAAGIPADYLVINCGIQHCP